MGRPTGRATIPGYQAKQGTLPTSTCPLVDTDTRQSSSAMATAADEAHAVRTAVGSGLNAMQQIEESSHHVAPMASHIADASVEQFSASTGIAKEMDELTRLVEANGSSLVAVEQAVGRVEQAVGGLDGLVGFFRVV